MLIVIAIMVIGFLSLVSVFKFTARLFCVLGNFQKLLKLVLIVFLVWLDLCLVGCSTFGEACVHLLIISTPFMYIYVAGRPGKEG